MLIYVCHAATPDVLNKTRIFFFFFFFLFFCGKKGKQNSQSRKHDFQLRLQSKKKSSFWDPMLRTVDDGGSAPSGSTGYTCAFMWGDAEHKMLAHTSLDMQVTIEGLIAVHDTEWSVKYIYTNIQYMPLAFFFL